MVVPTGESNARPDPGLAIAVCSRVYQLCHLTLVKVTHNLQIIYFFFSILSICHFVYDLGTCSSMQPCSVQQNR